MTMPTAREVVTWQARAGEPLQLCDALTLMRFWGRK